jgi:hypothetical protein
MALTKTPIELSSTPGIVDNSNATAITIDSSENVGIGVTPESHYTGYVGIDFGKSGGLFSNASGTNVTGLSNNAYLNSDSSAWVYKETDEASYYNQTAGTHRFSVAPSGTAGNAITWSEAMRIDASGNVLVGKTATGIATVGAELKATGELLATVNSDACAFLNRKTSDGDIAVFRKDNTTVGSIGTSGGKLDIDGPANNSGLRFHESSLIPKKNDGVTNGEVDLGYNDGSTILGFRNLTLSGGVYLGGTGAANKLDDYEEGTWTLAITTVNGGESVGIGNTLGSYTKIGKQVTATIYTAAINISAAGSGSVRLGGLPFTCSGGNHSYAVPSFGHTNCFSYEVDGYVAINSNFIVPTRVSTVTSNALTVANPVYMMFTLTYFTDQ